jgi:tRNA(fMet)-specific endonuclease VapC
MEVTLDTNAYSDWVRKGFWNEEISHATGIIVPAIVLGELEHGFRNGTRYVKNRKMLESFLAQPMVEVCEVNETVARIYGDLCRFLQRAGTPIPSNDIWIGACACHRGSTLLTADRHFAKLPQVSVVWPVG